MISNILGPDIADQNVLKRNPLIHFAKEDYVMGTISDSLCYSYNDY